MLVDGLVINRFNDRLEAITVNIFHPGQNHRIGRPFPMAFDQLDEVCIVRFVGDNQGPGLSAFAVDLALKSDFFRILIGLS